MIHDKKEFGLGLALIASFFVVLGLIMSPLFEGGRNSLDYLDSTFNSISKNSAYYIPDVARQARQHDGTAVTLEIKAADAAQAPVPRPARPAETVLQEAARRDAGQGALDLDHGEIAAHPVVAAVLAARRSHAPGLRVRHFSVRRIGDPR